MLPRPFHNNDKKYYFMSTNVTECISSNNCFVLGILLKLSFVDGASVLCVESHVAKYKSYISRV